MTNMAHTQQPWKCGFSESQLISQITKQSSMQMVLYLENNSIIMIQALMMKFYSIILEL